MRRIFLLCLALVAMSLSWPVSAATPEGCAATNCVYLPIVGYASPVYERLAGSENTRDRDTIRCGEVINTLDVPIFDLQGTVRLYDENNQVLATYTDDAKLPVTLPGGLNIYCVIIPNEVMDLPTLSALRVKLHWSLDSQGHVYVPVSVSDLRPLPCYTNQFEATLRNDSGHSLQNVSAVSWLLEDYGTYGIHLSPPPTYQGPMKRDLAVGEATLFTATSYPAGCGDASVTPVIVAVGEVVQP